MSETENGTSKAAKVKPKCPDCGVEMKRSPVGCDPGSSVWECVNCDIEVTILRWEASE